MKAAGAVGATAFAGITQATPGREPGSYDPSDELVVGISNSVSMASAEATVQDATPPGMSVTAREEKLGFMAMEVPEWGEADANGWIASRLKGRNAVRYVEENVVFETQSDDPRFTDQYAPQQVRAPTAWDTTLGSEDVTVAIVDTGVDYTHPDLQSRFGTDKGTDPAGGDEDPDAPAGENHGTHVAGIASATTDNGVGVAGMSNSRLLACRALGGGSGSLTDIATAIRYAADNGADIINMSLGGGGYTDTLKNAVSYAVSNGALPICAAGNNGSRGVSYPAKYDECMAVSALDSDENLASFSQYGPDLDVAAPGVNVLSTWNDSPYNRISGTSMACPAASGVAALGKAADPDLGPNDLRARLKETAVDVGLSAEEQGAGRVDAANIVAGGGGGGGGTEQPVARIDVSPSNPDTGETVTFDGSASSDPDGGGIESYEWEASTGGTATGSQVEGSWDTAQDVTVTLTVTDDDGETDSAAVTVSIGGAANEAPTASFDVSPTDPTVGDQVTFDASGSSDPDGSVASYQWDFGDGSTATGQTVTNTYQDSGDYTVTLTVTDDDGATDTLSDTLTVDSDGGGGGGTCGDVTEGGSAESSLAGWWDSESFAYAGRTANPCQVVFTLAGEASTDFDLYVTLDGRTPTTSDFDKRSISPDSDEQIIVEDVSAGQEFGILVDAYSGSGAYVIEVEELGK
jgi:serine protease